MGVELTRTARARGEVHLVRLDLTLGSEIQKTRPCIVVSPDELAHHAEDAELAAVDLVDVRAGGQRADRCIDLGTPELALPWRIVRSDELTRRFSGRLHREPRAADRHG